MPMLVLPSLPSPCHSTGTGAADRASALRSRIFPRSAVTARAPAPPSRAIKGSTKRPTSERPAPSSQESAPTSFHVIATMQVSLVPHMQLPEHRLSGRLCLTYALKELCPHAVSNEEKLKIANELEEEVANQGHEVDEAGYRARVYRVAGYMMGSDGIGALMDLTNGRRGAEEVVRSACSTRK